MLPGETVYLIAPHGVVTGGPEAIHQLGAALVEAGADARVVYYAHGGDRPRGLRQSLARGGRPAAYAGYAVPEAETIVDAPANILVLPEVWTAAVDEFSRIRTAVWWLSVDNNLVSPYGRFFAHPARRPVAHLHQSAYAEAYLLLNGVAGSRHLADYLSPGHADDERLSTSIRTSLGPRRDLVLFNPRKGLEVTKRLAERAVERRLAIEWQPIIGMTALEVSILMRISKVYVDFGEHPGMDRMPREAAVAGCCVITGRRGASAFAADIPIDDRFKIADERIDEALDRIVECVVDYERVVPAFDSYRAFISDQPRGFRTDVAAIFGLG